MSARFLCCMWAAGGGLYTQNMWQAVGLALMGVALITAITIGERK